MTGKHREPETRKSRCKRLMLAICHNAVLTHGMLEVACGCAAIVLMERLWPAMHDSSSVALFFYNAPL